MRAIPRTIPIFIPVAANAAKAGVSINFPDRPELRAPGTMVCGLEVYSAALGAYDANGVATITAADAQLVTLTLLNKSVQRHQNIAFNLYNPQFLYGLYKEFRPFQLDPQRSYVTFNADAATVTAFSIPTVWHYYLPDDLK